MFGRRKEGEVDSVFILDDFKHPLVRGYHFPGAVEQGKVVSERRSGVSQNKVARGVFYHHLDQPIKTSRFKAEG